MPYTLKSSGLALNLIHCLIVEGGALVDKVGGATVSDATGCTFGSAQWRAATSNSSAHEYVQTNGTTGKITFGTKPTFAMGGTRSIFVAFQGAGSNLVAGAGTPGRFCGGGPNYIGWGGWGPLAALCNYSSAGVLLTVGGADLYNNTTEQMAAAFCVNGATACVGYYDENGGAMSDLTGTQYPDATPRTFQPTYWGCNDSNAQPITHRLYAALQFDKFLNAAETQALNEDWFGELFEAAAASGLVQTPRLGRWRRMPTRMVSGAWRYVRTLADAAANLAANVFNVDIAEALSASDSLSAQLAFAPSLSESASAADSISSALTAAASVAESAAATDAVSGLATYARDVSEAASAADTVSTGAATYAAEIAETATAVDAISALLHAAVTLAETGSAADTVSSLATLLASLAESVAASDIVSAGGATYGVDIAEAASAVDSLSAAWQAAVSVAETGSATDSVAAQVAFAQALAEAVAALDVLTAAGIFGVTVTETANATDSVSAPTGFGEVPPGRTITIQMANRTIQVH